MPTQKERQTKALLEEMESPKAEAPKEKKPATKKKAKYWFGRVSVPGHGVCSGEASAKQIAAFKKGTPKNVNLDYYLRDTDELEAQAKKAKARLRRKLGLKE